MGFAARAILPVTICSLLAVSAAAGQPRSASERSAFKRAHPCPSTGLRRGTCPGFVIDHVDPLCNGGADHHSNMQWQDTKSALEKDRWERRLCRSKHAPKW
jgi:hypothetical protein